MAEIDEKLIIGADGITRCWWPGEHADYIAYHDNEWGVPVCDDQRLFEKICLEGFQSGLSWLTILRKRDNFRAAFREFDFEQVARFNQHSVEKLLKNAGIIRNRKKIEATINNAKRMSELIDELGSLTAYAWSYEPQHREETGPMYTPSPEGHAMSKDLKKRGWKFVGPTTIYSFMQSVGIVNDHLPGCAAHASVEKLRSAFRRPV